MSLTLDGTSGITSSGGTNVLQADSVITANLQNSAVTTAKIADLGVTEGKLANNAVVEAKIANNAVTDAKIAAVAGGKITTGTVAAARLGSGTPDATNFLRGDGSWQVISTTPTTAQVLTATAGASFGAVGTYVQPYSAPSTSLGGTQAGSSLVFLDGGGSPYTGAVGGTWRSFGRGLTPSSELWLRIS